MTELGARLKEARLARGYSLDDLQNITKIQKRYLIGIEEGNYTIMPGSFYVRAFIKQYAEAVGLDADEVLTEYRKDIPEMQKEEVAQSFTQSPSRRNMKATSSNKMNEAMPKLIVALFAIVIIVVITTLYIQKTGSTPDGAEEEIEPIEYEQNPNSTPTKPVEGSEENTEADTEENTEPEEPVTEEPEAAQTISEGVVQGEDTTFEVSGTDSLNIRVEVAGDTWVGIRNENRQEQVNARVYKAGEVVEHDSTANGYARIRLGNSKVAKVYVNDVELAYAQDMVSQNVILKLVNEGQGE
ncbi:cytoskeletal protein RodZ [Solibacillus kalamii]|uniref:Helix-turn-helix domain-containing protein n=1 Tax=Solibacillus kalamii TaxID=1748298 RepID=A0ABX3ZLP9_9BACL|nr:RodZ domain-containing protein [Solibacillus kalamii]MBM7665238.1 cytoskeletal protein RodZ [Solibacillus kalamii]OUZ40402.1 helix-turn-helix domain-containing protein [Solibacillus kalamii]